MSLWNRFKLPALSLLLLPMIFISTAAALSGRDLWNSLASNYPWGTEDACIQHPTFRGGSIAAYTAAVESMTAVFESPLLTDSIEPEILFNSEANIPMSSCKSLLSFSQVLEQSGMVDPSVRERLQQARQSFESSLITPLSPTC